MRGQLPTVMVSSTYFDLREIRQQLASFIERDLGYRSMISESPEFPIDPDADAIENCRRRVEQNADVLVLIVGSRYGFVESTSGKSVTNLEYLGARSKGIPIYAFIDKRTLTLFEAWQGAAASTRTALGSTVENVRLFEFVEEVRATDGVWMVGFETASEIINSLRVQLAYAVHSGLELQRTLRRHPERELLRTLAGKAFRLALDKPEAWEYRLFGQVLADSVDDHANLRREYDLNLALGSGELVGDEAFLGWARLRLDEANRLAAVAAKLISSTLQDALGPAGVPGNAAELVFVARQFGRVYREAIDWTFRVRRAHPESEDLQEVIDALADCSRELVSKLGDWGKDITSRIDQALAEAARLGPGQPKLEVAITIVLEGTDLFRYTEVLRRVYRRRGVVVD
jgi:hypothetical protein